MKNNKYKHLCVSVHARTKDEMDLNVCLIVFICYNYLSVVIRPMHGELMEKIKMEIYPNSLFSFGAFHLSREAYVVVI